MRMISAMRGRRAARKSSYVIDSQPGGSPCSEHILPHWSLSNFARKRGTLFTTGGGIASAFFACSIGKSATGCYFRALLYAAENFTARLKRTYFVFL